MADNTRDPSVTPGVLHIVSYLHVGYRPWEGLETAHGFPRVRNLEVCTSDLDDSISNHITALPATIQP